jgi:GNAT superfamily N-acetyltransferase
MQPAMTLKTHTAAPPSAHSLTSIEQRTWADLIDATAAPVRRQLGLAAEWHGAALLLASTGAPGILFNRAVGVPTDAVPSVMDRYRTLGVGRYVLQPSPGEDPAALLEVRGLTRYRRSWVKLVRAVGAPATVETKLHIRRARSDDADRCGVIVAQAFDLPDAAGAVFAASVGRPRWHVYVACDADDRPVAVSALFVDEGIGELAFAATAPQARGRGAQPALIAQRILAAEALGCTYVATETGLPISDEPNPSYRNLLAAGFTIAHKRDNFAPPGTTFT